jgi:co-chaperonin GroES (HSP10)
MVQSAVVTPVSSPIDEAFPEMDFGIAPAGSRILVQIRRPKTKSKGGILFAEYSKQAEQDNTQVAKVIAIGPLAYHNRDSMKPWPEGAWCKVGDYVFVSKYAGARWKRVIPNTQGETVEFVIFNDLDVLGTVYIDPLEVQAHVGA